MGLGTGDCVGDRDGALEGERYGDGTGDGISLELSCVRDLIDLELILVTVRMLLWQREFWVLLYL